MMVLPGAGMSGVSYSLHAEQLCRSVPSGVLLLIYVIGMQHAHLQHPVSSLQHKLRRCSSIDAGEAVQVPVEAAAVKKIRL